MLVIAAAAASRPCTASVRVNGRLGSARIETTVDSEQTKYLVANYLTGHRSRPAFDAEIDALRSRNLTDSRTVSDISRTWSPDFAAVLLAEYLIEHNARVQQLFDAHVAAATSIGRRRAIADRASGLTVLLVPGWLYRRHPETGAALEEELRTMRRLGVSAERVATSENGSVEANARIISATIRAVRDDRMIIVSASKGGPETLLALQALQPDERERVAAWINVGGILHGTALADKALAIPRRWLTGLLLLRHCEGVVSMTTYAANSRQQLPLDDVMIVNFVAIPLSGDLTAETRSGYCALREHGPNDGLTLITDAIQPHSLTITALGSDHFFRSLPAEKRAIALLETVLDLLDRTTVRANSSSS